MSDSPASAPAVTTAEELASIVELVSGELAWTIAPANRVTLAAGSQPRTPELGIHEVQPSALSRIAAGIADSTTHEDADGILRWVAATLNGVDVTWFRR